MQDSISTLVALFDRYRDLEVYNLWLAEEKKKLASYRGARKYEFISNIVDGKKKHEENLPQIRDLELQLATLPEESKGHLEENFSKIKQKVSAYRTKTGIGGRCSSKERKLKCM